MTVNRY